MSSPHATVHRLHKPSTAGAHPSRTAPSPGSRRLGASMIAAAAVYLLMNVGMVAFITAASPAPTLGEQVPEGFGLYRWGFLFASLLAPALLWMLALLVLARGSERLRMRDRMAMVFAPAYLLCASIAYSSQYVLVPRLAERDLPAASLWYFHDERSLPFALDLLGYALLGLGLLLLAVGFVSRGGRLRLIGWSMGLVAVFSLAAFAALGWGSANLAGTLSVVSAGFTAVLALLVAALGVRMRRGREREPAPDHHG